ncbi:MAG: hypothetical protein LUD41_06210 [Phascolarctobacterium sp.]|nr:hypothetical protein [Phascolarctobacterium sp.]
MNLITANPVPEKGIAAPGAKAAERFRKLLERNGINVTVRNEMGKDISAACGQLRADYIKESK